MLSTIFETYPGRSQEFFKLLRYIGLLIMGPTAILQYRRLSHEMFKTSTMAALAIYSEALLEAFIHCLSTIRLLHHWRRRCHAGVYTRRLLGVRVPAFVLPLRRVDGVEVIGWAGYLRVCVLAAVCAGLISTPVIWFDAQGIGSTVEAWVNKASLFVMITLGTGGNVLTGLVFMFERLDAEGLLHVQSGYIRVVMPVLYASWLVFALVEVAGRVWVYSSADKGLRALANVCFFGVGVDSTLKMRLGGRIDVGRVYVNLRECGSGVGVVLDVERGSQEVDLNDVEKLV